MYGLDLGELWRNREVARVLDLLEYLPPTSHYIAAVSQDDEVAEQLAQQEREQPSPSGPPLTEFSTEVQHLVVIANVLLSLRALFLQANGAKGVQPPPPLPTPVTASQRYRRAQREAVRSHVMSRLLPPGRGEPPASPARPQPPRDE